VDVSIVGVADPDGDAVTITVTGIDQDEPIDSEDVGNPCPDAAGVGSSIARLRAERRGRGDGRVYHVTFLADDARGGQCNGTVTVCVPKTRGAVCVDQGPLFDSVAVSCPVQCGDVCTVEMAISSVCVGERVPPALSRVLERSRLLSVRAAEATNARKAKRLATSAMKRLQKVARIAAHAAQQGTISPACAGALEGLLDEVRIHLARSGT
jgi:hypothetical protein